MHSAEMWAGPEGYLLLFSWVFAEQIGLPLPATPALLAAGAMAATGSSNIGLIIVVALLASVLGDFLWYRAGIMGGHRMDRFLRRHRESRIVRGAERLFGRYGGGSLVLAKFVPGLSLAVPPLSGMYGMAVARFLFFDTLASLMWAGGLTAVGYFSGRTICGFSPIPWRPVGWFSAIVALAIGCIGLGRNLWCSHRVRSSSEGLVEGDDVTCGRLMRAPVRCAITGPERVTPDLNLVVTAVFEEPDRQAAVNCVSYCKLLLQDRCGPQKLRPN